MWYNIAKGKKGEKMSEGMIWDKVFKESESASQIKLSGTKLIKEFNTPDVISMLTHLYNHAEPDLRKMGTLINSAFCHQRQTFLITKRNFSKLIKEDINSEYKSIDSITYKSVMRRLFKGGILIRLREPKKGRAQIVKLVKGEIVSLLYKYQSEEFFAAQERIALDYYDEKANEVNEINEYLKECKEKVDGKRK